MADDFGFYARQYRDIINRSSRISGEKYEFFIRLRVSLMRHRLNKAGACLGLRRILDFGCGIGAAGEILEAEFPQAEIVGIDPSEESIIEARRLGLRRTEFMHGEGEALPLPEDSVDLLYSNGVLHHIHPEKRLAVLREFCRVVRPNGNIFLFENNPFNPLIMRAMRRFPLDADAQVLAAGELAGLLKDGGFSVLKTGYYFLFPHLLRFLRWSEPLFERLPLGAQYFVWGVRKK